MNPTTAGLVPAVPGGCPVVLSWGLGVDSTAVLLRWLTDPACRDFTLPDLAVVVAMTGDEWARTGADAIAHVLPVLREHGVRLVQVARARRLVTKAGDGVTVLDDSTTPQMLHLPGAFTLGQELADAGTVPQTGGSRLCSVHAKGNALDPTIAALTAGRVYRHAVGFEAGETRRAVKDATFKPGLSMVELIATADPADPAARPEVPVRAAWQAGTGARQLTLPLQPTGAPACL